MQLKLNPPTPSVWPWLGKVLLLAAAYFVTGKLGLLLAVPPGYATAIWPPSGIALVGLLLLGPRHWPGVVLGSFCVNVGLEFDASSTAAIIKSLAIGLSIALAAGLQGVAGVWLLRRFIGWPAPLIEDGQIFRFLLLSGPVSCLVNASWGVGTLWLAGFVPTANLPVNWSTWWAGDTLGVWIFTLIGLLVFGLPRETWRPRRLTVGLPLVVTFAIAVGVFVHSRAEDRRELRREFQESATHQAELVAIFAAKPEAIERIGPLVEEALKNTRRNGIQLQILEVAAAPERQLLYSSQPEAPLPAARTEGVAWATELDVGGRTCRLQFTPTLAYLGAHQSRTLFLVQLAGLLFTSLLGAGLLLVTGRTALVEGLVQQRSVELRHANDGLTNEIAERKKIEARREELLHELEAKNGEMERFSYVVSHDLKSPLITIKSFLGMVEKDAAAGRLDRLKSDLQRIAKAADKMGAMLEDLLKLSRVGRLQNPFALLPMHLLAAEAVELVGGRLLARGAEVELDPGLAAVSVWVDRPRLVEVLQNLVENAVKYMGDQAQPRIVIGTAPGVDGPQFYVRDNGMGIEPAHQSKVFGLFDKLDPKSEGTGIGLALVKRSIETHGGRLWVESAGAGCGSTFWFTLAAPPPPTNAATGN